MWRSEVWGTQLRVTTAERDYARELTWIAIYQQKHFFLKFLKLVSELFQPREMRVLPALNWLKKNCCSILFCSKLQYYKVYVYKGNTLIYSACAARNKNVDRKGIRVFQTWCVDYSTHINTFVFITIPSCFFAELCVQLEKILQGLES